MSGPKGAKIRRSMDSMMVSKSASSNEVLPGPPGKRVSPVNRRFVPSTAKQMEPGVWPGVASVLMRRSPTLEELVVVEDEVVAGQHAGVGAGHGHRDAGVAHRRDGLDVVPVPVRLDHLVHAEALADLEQLLVLVGGVDQHARRPCAGSGAM